MALTASDTIVYIGQAIIKIIYVGLWSFSAWLFQTSQMAAALKPLIWK